MDEAREQNGSTPSGTHLLSNGRYAVLFTTAGAGYSAFEGFALTRWMPDPTRDADGFFLYIRDLDSGDRWSAGYQPLPSSPADYEVRWTPGRAEIVREDTQIQTRMQVCVAAEDNVELRRLTLTNDSDRPRRLELTTYAEVVLNTPAGDAGHPAFSKLFVQTTFLAEQQALVAWRRLRSLDDQPLWLVHRLVGAAAREIQFETDRARFLGRGRTPANPRALDADVRLSGTIGNVLDPVFSLRRVVEIAPGETAQLTAVLGAGREQEEVVALAERYGAGEAIDAAFEGVMPAPEGAERALGVPASWLEGPPFPGPSPAGGERRPADPAVAENLRFGRMEFPLSQFWERGLGGEGSVAVSSICRAPL
ncbi:MAG TPA: hypothetical protein VGR27_15200, partial [Longimicrobiaceae bacterium]|nr:hypothetical protein [Longimicrobiaceae bacterium]